MRRSVLAATAMAGAVIAVVCWTASLHDPEPARPAVGESPSPSRASAARTPRRTVPRGPRAVPPEPVAAERARAADEAWARVRSAAAEDRWNDALRELRRLEDLVRDADARKTIGLDSLSEQIVKGRDGYFTERIAPKVFETVDALIAARAREDDRPTGTEPPPGAAKPGTLAAARQWQNREMHAALWEKVAADLGLTRDELEKYWKSRRVEEPRTASYGGGSVVVVKRRPAAAAGEAPQPSHGNARPVTDEEWWSAADTSARGAWLTANFVETSGLFEVLRADDARCGSCDGSGACPACGGCGRVRTVTYR